MIYSLSDLKNTVFYSFSPLQRIFLLTSLGFFVITGVSGVGVSLYTRSLKAHAPPSFTPIGQSGMSVLAAESEANDVRFMVNVPSVFQERATFENGITVSPELTLNGKLILSD